MLLEAAKSGCDIVDGAVSSMSGLTSQPSLNALVAALEWDRQCPDVPLPVLDKLALYWEGVRSMYQVFDPGIRATSTDVYSHEIPGGQYSNLYQQARKVGLSAEEFYELTLRYQEVNQMFGNLIKVTPSSKVVGDMALLLQKHKLTGPQYLHDKPKLDYPDSVSFFKGYLGVPYGDFPREVREMVLGENPPAPCSQAVEDNDSLESVRKDLEKMVKRNVENSEVLSYRLYPKVFKDYLEHHRQYGKTSNISTPVFFFGVKEGEEVATDLEKGKTLIFKMNGMSEPNDKGERSVFFNLNGFPREIEVVDESIASAQSSRPKVDPMSDSQIGANMPGKVLAVNVQAGDEIEKGQVVLVTESMKMEYAVTAKRDGKVSGIYVKAGDMVEGGDLLVEIQ